MNHKSTILITGVNGYLGQHIAAECKSHDAVVIGSGRQSYDNMENFRKADLLQFDGKKLLAGIDTVIHSAAILPSTHEARNFDDNISITLNLIRACIANQVEHFVYISSASIYAKSDEPHDENSKLSPDSPYGESKLECEHLLQEYKGKLQITLLRMGTIFGPNMPKNNNIQRLIQTISSGLFIQFGSAENQKSLLHIHDAARVCSHVVFNYQPSNNLEFSVFNIAPPPLKMIDIISAICKGLSKKRPLRIPLPAIQFSLTLLKPILPIFRKLSSIHDSVTKFLSNDILNGDKFTSQTNFIFKVDLVHALEESAEEYSKNIKLS